MITRIRNSIMVKSREVVIVRSNLVLSIVEVLKTEGFIDSFEECGNVLMSNNGFMHSSIRIVLKYKGTKQKPYITNIKRVSKPGFRIYTNSKNIPKVMGGIGVAVFATRKLDVSFGYYVYILFVIVKQLIISKRWV